MVAEATATFRPLGDRVLVERLEAEEVTSAGLYIPPIAQEKTNRGRVLAVGTGRVDADSGIRIPLDVKRGDLVLFGKYSGADVKIDGAEAIIMREEEILGVIDEVG